MKNKKLSLYSNIYFGISLVAPIFILFFDINSLFMIAYSPMLPDFIGGKTFFAAFYLVAAIAVYISLLFKKRAPIFAFFALSAVFEVFNLLSPAISSGEKYLYSLFSASGNLTSTVKTLVLLVIVCLAFINLGIKNKALKIAFRALAVSLPAAFLIFEFITLSKLDSADVLNFTDKAEASLAFDFLRFTPAVMFTFVPEVRL